MTDEARILIVDDDPLFLAEYRDILKEEGLLAEVARDRETALSHFDRDVWSAVLLDQKLQGPAGPDSGLDLISEAKARCPAAKVLVITGYATPRSVQQAFAAGAYDFLEKTPALSALLRIKLRAVHALYRAQRAEITGRDDLRNMWQGALRCDDRSRKGKLLEDFIAALVGGIRGFGTVIETNLRTDIEEIDGVIRNDARTAPWNREKAYFLVECKNWSARVDRAELDVFAAKMMRRKGRCSVGFFIAPGGFTDAFMECLRRDAGRPNILVIPLDRAAIEALIDTDDRLGLLSRLHMKATAAA